MRLLIQTFSSSEHENDNCDFALVDVGPEFGKSLAGKMVFFRATQQSSPDLLEMTFEDKHCKMYSNNDISKELRDITEELSGWSVLPDDIELPTWDKGMTLYLVINRHGFYWQGFPDECEFDITTDVVPQEALSQVI